MRLIALFFIFTSFSVFSYDYESDTGAYDVDAPEVEDVEDNGAQNLGTFSGASDFRTPASATSEQEETVNEQTGTFE